MDVNVSGAHEGKRMLLFDNVGDQLTSLTFAAPRVSLDHDGGVINGYSNTSNSIANGDLDTVERLKFFLATAPSIFAAPLPNLCPAAHADAMTPGLACQAAMAAGYTPSSAAILSVTSTSTLSSNEDPQNSEEHQRFRRFLLPNGEYVSCVLWNGLYHITGTDIIRTLVFRFRAFGRRISNMKKFEEGVFSDLRNLKAGVDATLEPPKSPFLELLFKYNCIRTQKKQKVFYWYSVPHDKLFLDALERDARREKLGLVASTEPVSEPALSFHYGFAAHTYR